MVKKTQKGTKKPATKRTVVRKKPLAKKSSAALSSKISLIVTTLRAINDSPQSAPQISKILKFSLPTINSCLSELEDKKLIKYEIEKPKSGRGRPGRIFYLTSAGAQELKKIA